MSPTSLCFCDEGEVLSQAVGAVLAGRLCCCPGVDGGCFPLIFLSVPSYQPCLLRCPCVHRVTALSCPLGALRLLFPFLLFLISRVYIAAALLCHLPYEKGQGLFHPHFTLGHHLATLWMCHLYVYASQVLLVTSWRHGDVSGLHHHYSITLSPHL